MHRVTTIGLDIAKSVFQVHGIDAIGKVVIRRQLKRRYVLASFRSCRHASSALRPAHRRIIGHARPRRWGTQHRLIYPLAILHPIGLQECTVDRNIAHPSLAKIAIQLEPGGHPCTQSSAVIILT